jgi:diguanylate cyclase (GGDEF)-like protein/PAS domain S-box-containing protein
MNHVTDRYLLRLRRFQRFAHIVSIITVAMGVSVIIGWQFDIGLLKSFLPGLATMKVNTALCFILLGAALYLSVIGSQRTLTARTFALTALLIGTLTLAQYILKLNFGIDELLFYDAASHISSLNPPGRMAPATALYMLAIGVAILLLQLNSQRYVLIAQLLGLFGPVIGFFALVGYSYDLHSLYSVFVFSSVSLPSATLFVLLGLGILCAHPSEGFMNVITSEYQGGFMARKILPLALLLPLIIGWMRYYGDHAKWYGFEFGEAVAVTANIVVFALLIWFSARHLNVIDIVRKSAENALRDNEQKLRKVIDGLGPNNFVGLLSPEGIVLEANQPALNVAGLSLEDVVGKPVDQTPWFTYSTVVQEQLRNAVAMAAAGVPSRYDVQVCVAGGDLIWLDFSIFPYCDEDGRVIYLVPSSNVIEERKRAEQELRIAAVAFEADEGIMITNADKIILRVNKSFTKITGFSAEEAVGQKYPMLLSGKHDDQFYRDIWDSLSSKHHWYGEIWNRRKNNEVYPEWLNITAVTNNKGEITNYVASFADITVRRAAEEKIELLAFYDPLTGMPNRRLLHDRLQQSFTASVRHNNHGALLFIDLDHFKILNDSKGHNIGDILLVEAAKRLQACIRKVDTAARLGGDEFVILLGDLGEEEEQAASEVEAICEKILSALSQPYALKGYEYHGSASIGIYLFCRNDDTSVEEALKCADNAMYQAKNAGRNTLRFYDPAMQKVLEARIALEADLRRAIAGNQFEMYYQVQVNHTGHAIGAEALIRWNHPKLGIVSPLEFIPLAEETGLILPIGSWVLDTACAQLKAWEANSHTRKLQLAVNVSARQFFQPDFIKQVRKTLNDYSLKSNLLKLEITESAILDNIDDAIIKMIALKKIGLRFSLDDFGTGYSSLSYLTQLPLDQLKIDKSFVNNIGSKTSDAIVQTIIGMSDNLGMEVIAEGVETEKQRIFLERNGCKFCQGYLFGMPLPLGEFEAKLKLN